jgi:hypothetical protein
MLKTIALAPPICRRLPDHVANVALGLHWGGVCGPVPSKACVAACTGFSKKSQLGSGIPEPRGGGGAEGRFAWRRAVPPPAISKGKKKTRAST